MTDFLTTTRKIKSEIMQTLEIKRTDAVEIHILIYNCKIDRYK